MKKIWRKILRLYQCYLKAEIRADEGLVEWIDEKLEEREEGAVPSRRGR
jgi:hypothetical protein